MTQDNARGDLLKGLVLRAYYTADPALDLDTEWFLSTFAYPRETLEAYLEANNGSTAGYDGPVAIDSLKFDIDDGNIESALQSARWLAAHLANKYGDKNLFIWFSGSKGFHLEVVLDPVPCAPGLHQVARALATRIAAEVNIKIDTDVYSAVNLFRAANTRHARSGLFKIGLELDDLLDGKGTAVWIRSRATSPYEVDCPVPGVGADLSKDLPEASRDVPRPLPYGEAPRIHLNDKTRYFIGRPEILDPGERTRTMVSAAMNLAAYSTRDDLIRAMLMESALEIGLVREYGEAEILRQIGNGIKRGTPAMASGDENGRPTS